MKISTECSSATPTKAYWLEPEYCQFRLRYNWRGARPPVINLAQTLANVFYAIADFSQTLKTNLKERHLVMKISTECSSATSTKAYWLEPEYCQFRLRYNWRGARPPVMNLAQTLANVFYAIADFSQTLKTNFKRTAPSYENQHRM